MPEMRALNSAETLTYLHATISTRRHNVALPETPLYLDGLLADTPLTGGLEPKLGDLHLRTLSVIGFPNLSRPGILDALNHQDFAYRWVTRFIALDKTDATKALTKLRRQWFNKRKSITAMLREVMYNQPAQLLDSDADNKVVDADLALQALGGDHVAFGYLTTTITVSDDDRGRAEDKVRAVERIINGLGFTTIREGVNAVEAWLSSLPGHAYANVRQPLVHTLNLAHLMPLSSVWAGPARNIHLDGPPLLVAQTSGSTPFRLATHIGDVGHMLVVGPTGAGKSVLLALDRAPVPTLSPLAADHLRQGFFSACGGPRDGRRASYARHRRGCGRRARFPAAAPDRQGKRTQLGGRVDRGFARA